MDLFREKNNVEEINNQSLFKLKCTKKKNKIPMAKKDCHRLPVFEVKMYKG